MLSVNDDIIINNERLVSKRFRSFNEDISYAMCVVWRNRGQTFCVNVTKNENLGHVVNPRRDDDDCCVVIVVG